MDYDNKFIILTTAIITVIVIFSTILHHLYPYILQVPNVRGPYSSEPIWIDLIISDLIIFGFASVTVYHGIKSIGKFKTFCFLYGTVLFAGLEECIWILGGRFKIIPFETYFFTRGGLWLLEIPFDTCLAWFVISYSCLYITKIIFPNRIYIFHAFIAGILAVSLDLFMDPVMVNLGSVSRYSDSKGNWVWLNNPKESFSIFSIPFNNFIGWFLVIFLFIVYYGYILDDEKIKSRGKNKSLLIFFGFIPFLLIICVIFIVVIYFIFNSFLIGINIIPIGNA